MATAFLLVLLMLLMPKGAAFAEDENDGIDLIDNPSIPVIVLHIDETQGATIDEMNADQEHKTEE